MKTPDNIALTAKCLINDHREALENLRSQHQENLDDLINLAWTHHRIDQQHPVTGETLLHVLAAANCKDLAISLVKDGADLEIQDNSGIVPWFGSNPTQRALCQMHNETEKGEKLGNALLIAAKRNQDETALSLVRQGADVNFPAEGSITGPGTGITPLIAAAGLGHLDMVELLIHLGADTSFSYTEPAKHGRPETTLTAQGVAEQNKHEDIVDLLRELEQVSDIVKDTSQQ